MSAGTALSKRTRVGSGVLERARPVSLDHRSATVWVLALCALAAFLRFYRIGHQGFWFDEGNTVLLVHFSLGKMLGLIPQTESTPPLYYCVAWVWARVFGFGEAGLRSLSATAGVLTVPVFYGAGARLVSRPAGLVAAALCACNPFLIWYSQEARSYSLLVLLCAASLLAFAHVLERPSRGGLLAWVLACGLALATHYYAVVVVVPQAAWLLYVHRRSRAVRVAVVVAIACGLALIPLAIKQNGTGRDTWIGHSPLGVRLGQIVPQFLIGTDAPARMTLKFAAMALALVALGLLVTGARGRLRRHALLGAGLAIAGFIISLLFVAAGKDTLITRNIIGLWLPATIAVAGGLVLARPRLLGVLVAGALCGIGLSATIAVATTYDFERPDWRLVARALGPTAPPGGERLILIQHYRTLLPLSLYLPGLAFLGDHTAHRVSEIDVVAMSSPQQPLCWWGAACNLIPSQIQQSYAVSGFREVWRRQVKRFTIVRLVALTPQVVSPDAVSRALHTTTLPRDDLLIQR